MVIDEIPCIHCGELVKKHVDPQDKGHLKVYCYKHRHLGIRPRKSTPDTSNGLIHRFVKDIMINNGSGPVTIYRPGDKGFDEIAAQCDLKPKKPKPYYNAFEHRNYHDTNRS